MRLTIRRRLSRRAIAPQHGFWEYLELSEDAA